MTSVAFSISFTRANARRFYSSVHGDLLAIRGLIDKNYEIDDRCISLGLDERLSQCSILKEIKIILIQFPRKIILIQFSRTTIPKENYSNSVFKE